mmetsp:Transcript_16616/g.64901  ORF Transcript_16616/g.64901 Transcript_16616/m.64901 type:complete len:559 (-) Transcript_16616:1266-2942(-)
MLLRHGGQVGEKGNDVADGLEVVEALLGQRDGLDDVGNLLSSLEIDQPRPLQHVGVPLLDEREVGEVDAEVRNAGGALRSHQQHAVALIVQLAAHLPLQLLQGVHLHHLSLRPLQPRHRRRIQACDEGHHRTEVVQRTQPLGDDDELVHHFGAGLDGGHVEDHGADPVRLGIEAVDHRQQAGAAVVRLALAPRLVQELRRPDLGVKVVGDEGQLAGDLLLVDVDELEALGVVVARKLGRRRRLVHLRLHHQHLSLPRLGEAAAEDVGEGEELVTLQLGDNEALDGVEHVLAEGVRAEVQPVLDCVRHAQPNGPLPELAERVVLHVHRLRHLVALQELLQQLLGSREGGVRQQEGLHELAVHSTLLREFGDEAVECAADDDLAAVVEDSAHGLLRSRSLVDVEGVVLELLIPASCRGLGEAVDIEAARVEEGAVVEELHALLRQRLVDRQLAAKSLCGGEHLLASRCLATKARDSAQFAAAERRALGHPRALSAASQASISCSMRGVVRGMRSSDAVPLARDIAEGLLRNVAGERGRELGSRELPRCLSDSLRPLCGLL